MSRQTKKAGPVVLTVSLVPRAAPGCNATVTRVRTRARKRSRSVARAQSGPAVHDVAVPRSPNEYEVGYGNPPLKHRFPKGKSGNPKGRPKGQKNFRTLVRKEMQKTVTVNGPKGPRRHRRVEVAAMSVSNKAAKGDPRALAIAIAAEDASSKAEFSTIDHVEDAAAVTASDLELLDWYVRAQNERATSSQNSDGDSAIPSTASGSASKGGPHD
jgi:hypothetical protein